MVYWECDPGYWDKEKTGKNKREDTQDPIEGLSAAFTSSFPSLDDYTELLRAYVSRVLSYSEDSLFSFLEITTALGRVFAGGFVSGLPMMFFDIALLWESHVTSTQRALVLDTHKNPCLPSWSWVGWEGKVSTHNWEAGNCHIKKSSRYGGITLHRVGSILQWSVSEVLESSKKQINVSWQCFLATIPTMPFGCFSRIIAGLDQTSILT
jgi:hypothetical protein